MVGFEVKMINHTKFCTHSNFCYLDSSAALEFRHRWIYSHKVQEDLAI